MSASQTSLIFSPGQLFRHKQWRWRKSENDVVERYDAHPIPGRFYVKRERENGSSKWGDWHWGYRFKEYYDELDSFCESLKDGKLKCQEAWWSRLERYLEPAIDRAPATEQEPAPSYSREYLEKIGFDPKATKKALESGISGWSSPTYYWTRTDEGYDYWRGVVDRPLPGEHRTKLEAMLAAWEFYYGQCEQESPSVEICRESQVANVFWQVTPVWCRAALTSTESSGGDAQEFEAYRLSDNGH